MLKQRRKTLEEDKKWYGAAWSHIWIPALLEVDLEPRANRGANRTKSLVFSDRLQACILKRLKKISHKSTEVDPVRLS